MADNEKNEEINDNNHDENPENSIAENDDSKQGSDDKLTDSAETEKTPELATKEIKDDFEEVEEVEEIYYDDDDDIVKVGRAYSKMLRIGYKKLQSIAREIRRPYHKTGEHMQYEYAVRVISNTNCKAARYIEKALKSAFHNLYEQNKDAKEENAFIKTIKVDKALSFKRIRPRARGRADRYSKHNSHLTVEVGIK